VLPCFSASGRFAPRIFARRTTPFTTTVGFEADGGPPAPRRFWLKVYHREPEAAGHEFAFLREAAARLNRGPDPGVVEPVAWLPEIGGLVTAHVEGPSLATLLEADADDRGHQAGHCRAAGRLLARLHGAAAPAGGERFDFAPVLEAIRREVGGFSPAIRRRLDDELERLARRISPEECVLRPGHGDYGPYNLIAAVGGPVALDPSFHGAFPRPGNCSAPAEDLAKFAAWLHMVRSPPASGSLQEAFFSGYREAGGAALEGASASFRVLFTYCLLRGLRDWGGVAARLAGGRLRARALSRWLDERAEVAPATS